MGARAIDIITSDGNLAPSGSYIKNARRQPVFYQLQYIQDALKPTFQELHKKADMRQIRETNPFNIYGRIVHKSKKGSAYYYTLLAYKHNKTLLWEKSRIALERDWEKVNINITLEIGQYENIIRSVLKMKHHNYLKQFMLKLFRNNLYFKNVTSKFTESGIICNACKDLPENRPHFFICRIHTEIIQKLFACFVQLKLLKIAPNTIPYFYNHTISINHPTNLIHISILKYMYNLRFEEIIPNLSLVSSHISKFVSIELEMHPYDTTWATCQKIPLMIKHI